MRITLDKAIKTIAQDSGGINFLLSAVSLISAKMDDGTAGGAEQAAFAFINDHVLDNQSKSTLTQ